MNTLIITILLIYCFWVFIMIISWIFIPKKSSTKIPPLNVTVIIPFRNEKEHLELLTKSLSEQTLDTSQWQVLLVDDHSEDSYVLHDLPANFKLVKLPEDQHGKKRAIAFGIDQSDADIIVTSDADCSFYPDWLKTVLSYFDSADVQMVFGGVAFRNINSWFSRFQQIEFSSLIGVGAASINLGFPIMCNGANLAYRKTAFQEVNGYSGNDHIASGDDEYLLAKIKRFYPKGVKYIKEEAAVVCTNPCSTISEFIKQRKRWSSKWSANSSFYKLFVVFLVLISSIALLFASESLFLSFDPILAALVSAKVILDAIFLNLVLNSFRQMLRIISYIMTVLFYPLYVIFFAVISNRGGYIWKGRFVNNS